MSNNLQMIHENAEGEVHALNDHMGRMDQDEQVAATQVKHIENDINLIQTRQDDLGIV